MPGERPDVSVVLATRNRDTVLASTLAHMARSIRGSDLDIEFVVVDNGSDDSTPAILAYFERHLPLTHLTEPRRGKNRALNRALAVAGGTLIVFTDDDVIPCDGWLDRMHGASLRWPEHDVFGGRIVPRFPHGREPAFSDPEFLGWAYSRWEPATEEGPTDELPFGPNFAVRAASLESVTLDESIGPGATGMGSETSLLRTLLARGSRIVYVPDASVRHLVSLHQLRPEYLARRAFRLGRGIARWSGDGGGPAIAGVPRHLWRTLVESWILARTPFVGARRRLKARLDHERARGQILEYRRGGA